MRTSELSYAGGELSDSEIQGELDRLWQELRRGGKLWEDAVESGIDASSLRGLLEQEREKAIAVERSGAGLDPLTTAILVKFVIPVAAVVAKDLWTKILLPRIEHNLGKALRPVPDPDDGRQPPRA